MKNIFFINILLFSVCFIIYLIVGIHFLNSTPNTSPINLPICTQINLGIYIDFMERTLLT